MLTSQYIELVKEFGGECFGRTRQGLFILKINLQKSTSSTNIRLNNKGMCNGLMQVFYQQVMCSKDPAQAIADFADQLDKFDINLAEKSRVIQSSLEEDAFINTRYDHLFKSLGLDLVESKYFSPFANEAWKKLSDKLNGIRFKLIDEKFSLFKESASSAPQSKASLDQTDKVAEFQEIIDYLQTQTLNTLITINLYFKMQETKLTGDQLPGHVIAYFKFKDKNGDIKIAFYDPNGLPTIFNDENKFSQFLQKYLPTVTSEIKASLSADDARISLKQYSANTNEFHHKMRQLEKLVKQRISQLSDTDDDKAYKDQLEILAKRCLHADKHGIYYFGKNPLEIKTKDPKLNAMAEKILTDLKKNESQFTVCPHVELVKLLSNDLNELRSRDPEFIQTAEQILNEQPASSSTYKPS